MKLLLQSPQALDVWKDLRLLRTERRGWTKDLWVSPDTGQAFGSSAVRHDSVSVKGQRAFAARGFRAGIERCWQLAWAARRLRVSWCCHAWNLLSLTREIRRRRRRRRQQKLCTSVWRWDDPSVPDWGPRAITLDAGVMPKSWLLACTKCTQGSCVQWPCAALVKQSGSDCWLDCQVKDGSHD